VLLARSGIPIAQVRQSSPSRSPAPHALRRSAAHASTCLPCGSRADPQSHTKALSDIGPSTPSHPSPHTSPFQAQLKYAQMKVQYKERMLPQIAEHIRQNSQKDGVALSYPSFAVEYTNRLALSAADHVHAISAHLEYARGTKRCTDFKGGFWCAACPARRHAPTAPRAPSPAARDDATCAQQQHTCAQQRHTRRSAYKATDIAAESALVLDGLQLSMSLHRKLLQDCNAVHQNALVVRDAEYECLDLSVHDAWASSSPLVRPGARRARGGKGRGSGDRAAAVCAADGDLCTWRPRATTADASRRCTPSRSRGWATCCATCGRTRSTGACSSGRRGRL